MSELTTMGWRGIRKFGLSHCDFPTTLGNVTLFLRTLTLNVDPRNNTPIPIYFTTLGVVFASCYVYVYVVSMVWFVFCRCMETGELLSALIIFSLGTASQIGPHKIVFMFYHSNKLRQLVGECLECDSRTEQGTRFAANLKKSLRTVKRRAIVFWCVIMGNGFLYLLEPILLPGRHLMEDLFVLWGLEPMFETPNYQIAFALTAAGVCFTVYLPSNATALQIIICGFIESQMLSWSKELSHLWDDAQINFAKGRNMEATEFNTNPDLHIQQEKAVNKYVNQRLKDIIDAHATNLSLIQKVEEVFKGAIAVEFSLLMIGLIAELLAGLQNTYMEVPFALMQVGMDCFIGQRIIDASEVFENAVYHCKWENFDKDNMKLVRMMLVTSQKTMKLSAGGITKLNFVSLQAIIKMIYSAYTTLSATVN